MASEQNDIYYLPFSLLFADDCAEGNHLNTLVWTTDLAGALRARHTERAYDASQRVQRQAANASEVDQMRSMMTNLVANAKQDGYSGAPL